MSYGELRPMEWSEIVDRAFTIYRRNFWTLYLLQLVPQLGFWLVNLAATPRMNAFMSSTQSPNPSPEELMAAFGGMALPFVVIMVVSLVVRAVQVVSVTLASAHALLAEPITAGQALSGALHRLPTVLATSVIAGLAYVAGFLCCCIPGFFLLLAFFVVIPAIVIEDCGPLRALSRSWELMLHGSPGAMHPMFKAGIVGLISFAVGLGIGAVGAVPQGIFQVTLMMQAAARGQVFDPSVLYEGANIVVFAFTTLFQQIVVSLVPPFVATAAVLLFYDLKMRSEGVDLLEDPALAGGGAPPQEPGPA